MLITWLNGLLSDFYADESGFVLSAEAALVGTVGVLGATVGLTAVSQSVNDELKDVAYAFRSLDQSYYIPARKTCGAWTAGSSFTQRSVEDSRADLCADIARWEHRTEDQQQKLKEDQDRSKHEMREHEIDRQHREMKKKEEQQREDDKKADMKKKEEMKKDREHKPEMKKPDTKKPLPKKSKDKDDSEEVESLENEI